MVEQPTNIIFKIQFLTQKFPNIKGKKLAGVHLPSRKKFFLDHPTVDHIDKHSIPGNLCLPLLEKSGNFMLSGKWSPSVLDRGSSFS